MKCVRQGLEELLRYLTQQRRQKLYEPRKVPFCKIGRLYFTVFPNSNLATWEQRNHKQTQKHLLKNDAEYEVESKFDNMADARTRAPENNSVDSLCARLYATQHKDAVLSKFCDQEEAEIQRRSTRWWYTCKKILTKPLKRNLQVVNRKI